MSKSSKAVCGFVFAAALITGPTQAAAQNTCVFSTSGTTASLLGDCTTDETVEVPDGWTLNGNGNTITAVDPVGGSFQGAVVRNAGHSANVVNLIVTTSGLSQTCKAGDQRLRGIMFDGASGVIKGNMVMNINMGASGCQEGNAIEVRNAPFDGSHPNTMTVVIEHNDVLTYQKTGIVVNGDVSADVRLNKVGGSATQANLAANSVQIGFGAHAVVEHNHIAGNTWTTDANWASSAVLVYLAAAGTTVRQNNLMEGNADVGIWIESDGVTVDNNRVFETGPDGYYDIGIGNWGANNIVNNNKVRGYAVAVDGASTKTVAIPSPNAPD